ncbi:hypothetical protein [Comamonas sp. C24C]
MKYSNFYEFRLIFITSTALILSACGGGEGGDSANGGGVVPGINKDNSGEKDPIINSVVGSNSDVPENAGVYPSAWLYNQRLSSMYTLSDVGKCDEYDAYCRLVANKDAIFDIELDASIDSVILQITPADTKSWRVPTHDVSCDRDCWSDHVNDDSAVHLVSEKVIHKGKVLHRIKVPGKFNLPKYGWLLQLHGGGNANGVGFKKIYDHTSVIRQYFEGSAINIVLVPLSIGGVAPKTLPNIFQIASTVGARVPLPIGSVKVNDVLEMKNFNLLDSAQSYSNLLRNFSNQVGAKAGDTFWYGMFSSSVAKTMISGMGYQPGQSAIGWDAPEEWGRTMTHEIGHNLSLRHSPCGGVSGVDTSYPYPNGDISALVQATYRQPFDLSQGAEVTGETKDVMGYCEGTFFSDYSISKVWRYWQKAQPVKSALAQKSGQPALVFPKPEPISQSSAVYNIETVIKHWDTTQPIVGDSPPSMQGMVYVWEEGLSNAIQIRTLSNEMEPAVPGLPIEVQHNDNLWYSAIASRLSESDKIEIWTPGPGSPRAIKIPGL